MSDENPFRIINFSADLLGSFFNARSVVRTVNAIQNAPNRIERGPAVVAPWELLEQNPISTLAGRFNAVRGKTDFFDLSGRSITQTQDKDEKALFALFLALNDLKAIADYAADKGTPSAILPRLNSQFRDGLAQTQDFLTNAELDKLTLIFGDKEPRATSEISLGKDDRDVIGVALAVNSKTQEIANLSGNEIFTLNLDKLTDNDDIVIDLSQITDTLNLANISTYINQQINAVTSTDTDGNEVRKYKAEFAVVELDAGGFALKINNPTSEKITLTAQTTEPALFITGSHLDLGSDKVETATFTKLNSLSGTPVTEFTQQIAGIDGGSFVPPLTDDDGNIIDSAPEVFETRANATVIDSQGNVYVVGNSQGDFGNQINGASHQDVFLNKFDAAGNLLFSRLLGASDTADAFDVVVDSDDNVFIAGQVKGELVTSDTLAGFDSFITKFDKTGLELWTHQQDTFATDRANSLAIDASGDVIVTGSISGQLNASTSFGGSTDIFVTRLSGADGALTASAQIGGAGIELGEAVAMAEDGNILIATREDGRAIIRKLDAADLTNELDSFDLGHLGGGSISDIVVDGSGAIFIAGSTSSGSLSGGTVTNAHSGGGDGFVTRLTDGGASLSAVFTNYLGSSGADNIEGLTVQNGAVYVAGKTDGTLPGGTKTGVTDGFAARIDATTGATDFIRQFGGVSGLNGSSSLAFSASGSSILTKLGLPQGLHDNDQTRDIETQTSARVGDHFFISVEGGPAQKITISAGEDFTSLARKIQRVSFRFIEAQEVAGTNGPELKIEGRNGSSVEIIAGEGARDALVKLGLKPAKILPADKLFNIGEDTIGTDPDNLGGIFALKLLSGLSLRNRQEAAFVSTQIDSAIDSIKRAFSSLTFDPLKAQILKDSKLSGGAIPAQLQKELSNYQDGLNRISLLGGGGGLNIFG